MWFYYDFKIENNGTTLSLVTETNMLGTFRKLTFRLPVHIHTFFNSPPMWTSTLEHGNNPTQPSSSLQAQLSTVRRPTEIKTKKSGNTHAAITRIYCVNKSKKCARTETRSYEWHYHHRRRRCWIAVMTFFFSLCVKAGRARLSVTFIVSLIVSSFSSAETRKVTSADYATRYMLPCSWWFSESHQCWPSSNAHTKFAWLSAPSLCAHQRRDDKKKKKFPVCSVFGTFSLRSPNRTSCVPGVPR